MKIFTLIFIIFISCQEIYSQESIGTQTNDHRRFALSVGIGLTQAFDRYEIIGVDNPGIEYITPSQTNLTLGLTWYHRSRWFTSLHWHQFSSTSGIRATNRFSANGSNNSDILNLVNERSITFSDYSFRVGRTHFFKNPKWQTRWLAGVSIKNIPYDIFYFPLNASDDPIFSLSQNLTPETQLGIAPSLQAGYQIAYRGKRMGLSLMILGNLGLKYYVLDEYTIRIDFEEFNTTINSKNDLIAGILQYEVYFGNTTTSRKEKRKTSLPDKIYKLLLINQPTFSNKVK
ncbi:MAG: hypothetical protein AAGI23_06040 [Bacteroidota bacterium]